MVANGEKMHAILLATQEEARNSKEVAEQSIKLAEDMKQDSVAMKTVDLFSRLFHSQCWNETDCRYDNVLPSRNFFCGKISYISSLTNGG